MTATHSGLSECEYYICTRSGVRFSLSRPRPDDVRLSDISYALGNIGRFTGHAHWTVADHSLYVAQLVVFARSARPHTALTLAALLHDAHEAYMGDIATPVEQELDRMGERGAITTLKRRIQGAIHLAFGLPLTLPQSWSALIDEADKAALVEERNIFLTIPPDGDWGWMWPRDTAGVWPRPELVFRGPSAFQDAVENFVRKEAPLRRCASVGV